MSLHISLFYPKSALKILWGLSKARWEMWINLVFWNPSPNLHNLLNNEALLIIISLTCITVIKWKSENIFFLSLLPWRSRLFGNNFFPAKAPAFSYDEYFSVFRNPTENASLKHNFLYRQFVPVLHHKVLWKFPKIQCVNTMEQTRSQCCWVQMDNSLMSFVNNEQY